MGRKTIKVASYFTKEELKLIKFVSNELLKVNERQFVKGAAIEMAQATLNMAQEKANAEAQQEAEGANDPNVESGVEQSSTEGGETSAIPEPFGVSEDFEATT